MFIERPDLDRNRRFAALELGDLELFLNRACSYRLALGLAGRGTCRIKSRRRRYSTPRCGETVRPICPVIQHATLRPSPPSGGGSLSRNSSSWPWSSSRAAPGLSRRPSPSPARPW
jgi:hypothetical protein